MSDLVTMIVAVVLGYAGTDDEVGHIWFDFCTCIYTHYQDSNPPFATEWWDRRYEYLDRSEEGWSPFRAPIS